MLAASVTVAAAAETAAETSPPPAATPYLYLALEQFTNLSGGLETGTSGFGLVEAGVDVDLERLLGWSGMTFHASGLLAGGEDPSVNAGDFNTLSNIAAPDGVYFYEAWFETVFADERARLKFGQMTVDGDFMGSEYGALFMNSAFGILNTFSGNSGVPTYPLGGVGALLQYTWPDLAYVQFAVYDGDAGSDQEHGVDYEFNDQQGAVFVYELGTDGFDAAGKPGTYKLGGAWYSGEFADLADGGRERGNYSFYLAGDQVLVQDADQQPKLAGFFRAGYSPQQERNTVNFYLEGGMTLFEPLSGRERDIAGIGFFYTDFSQAAVRALGLAAPQVHDSESVLEIFYQVQLTPWLTIKPEFQFIFEPLLAEDDALLFGTRLEASF